MAKLKIIDDKIFLFINNKKKLIGKLKKTKKGNVFRCSRSYDRHLYRKLNSFNICAKVLTLDVNYIIIEVVVNGNIEKYYGIKVDKLRKLRMDYNCDVNYYNYERQIAIPLIIMDFKLGDKTKKGIKVKEFHNKVDNIRSNYHNWNSRRITDYDKHKFNEFKDL